ncbi:MAG: hypothetical protein D6824_04070 [Planctomycetota bacterium]|nr:MAG: hypothetical protein D6824_04070 [Planctomycetota bacterium]
MTLVVWLASGQTGALLALAWRPVLDPAPVGARLWWLLLAPMALGVAMAYKAVRAPTPRAWARQTLVMTAQIIVGMTLAAAALHAVVEWAAPVLAAGP